MHLETLLRAGAFGRYIHENLACVWVHGESSSQFERNWGMDGRDGTGTNVFRPQFDLVGLFAQRG